MNYKQKSQICKCYGTGEKSGINLENGRFLGENEEVKTGEENGIIFSADRLNLSFIKKMKKIFK
ncbi:MAG: hypothetical protein NC123_19145 [Butyrivibrio sp.]|nr:hypothetical protein [Butyrivibrio sp.]